MHQVANKFRKEVNVKIQGSGVGGCDIILAPGGEDTSDCWCLWGTINYSFCAYDPKAVEEKIGSDFNSTAIIEDKEILGSGRCPKVTGESILCNDLTSLGNCYNGSYSCVIDSSGLCHCSTV